MRSHVTLVSAVIVALGAAVTGMLPAQAATGTSGRDARAIVAAKSHTAATRFGDAQTLRAVGTVVDPDGTSHVRLRRSYRGLEVVGGDLVVHQSRAGTWKGSSLTLERTLNLATTPAVSSAVAAVEALAPSKVTRKITHAKLDGSTLVVDATGRSPRLAWKVLSGDQQSDGTPSRLATYVDAGTGKVISTEQEIETVDGTGQSLYSGSVPLNLTKSGSTYQLKNAGVRGNTYTTDSGKGPDSYLCQVLGSGCRTGTQITSATTTFGNGSSSDRATAGAERSTAATRPGTTTSTRSVATGSSAAARGPTTVSTTAGTTSTPSGTAPR